MAPGLGSDSDSVPSASRASRAGRARHARRGRAAGGGAPDDVLLARAREGDDDAFAALYRRHARAVWRHARRHGLDDHAAEDVTGEAFARTLRAVRRGDGPRGSVREHLLATAGQVATGWHAGEYREQPPAVAGGGEATHRSAEAQALVAADQSLLVEAFTSLPRRWREVLWRTAVEREPLSRAGHALGLTANATAVLAHRAREGLREAYLQAHVSEAVTQPEDCRRYAIRLGAFIRRSSGSRSLRRHLEDCQRCRSAYLELVDVNATLRALLPIPLAGWLAAVAASGALSGPGAGDAASAAGAGVAGVTGGSGASAGVDLGGAVDLTAVAAGAGSTGAGGALGKLAVAAAVALTAGSAAPTAVELASGSPDGGGATVSAPDSEPGGAATARPAAADADHAGLVSRPEQRRSQVTVHGGAERQRADRAGPLTRLVEDLADVTAALPVPAGSQQVVEAAADLVTVADDALTAPPPAAGEALDGDATDPLGPLPDPAAESRSSPAPTSQAGGGPGLGEVRLDPLVDPLLDPLGDTLR